MNEHRYSHLPAAAVDPAFAIKVTDDKQVLAFYRPLAWFVLKENENDEHSVIILISKVSGRLAIGQSFESHGKKLRSGILQANVIELKKLMQLLLNPAMTHDDGSENRMAVMREIIACTDAARESMKPYSQNPPEIKRKLASR